jgi:hypothetical protein
MEKKTIFYWKNKDWINHSLSQWRHRIYFLKLFSPGHESENSIFLRPINFNLHAADRQRKIKQLDLLQFSFKFYRIHLTPNNKSLSNTKINKNHKKNEFKTINLVIISQKGGEGLQEHQVLSQETQTKNRNLQQKKNGKVINKNDNLHT